MTRRIRRVEQLERYRGKPVRISFDRGKTWYYAMVLDEPRHEFADQSEGYVAADEIKRGGSGGCTGITAKRLKDPNFLVETVDPKEVQGAKWSWPLGNR